METFSINRISFYASIFILSTFITFSIVSCTEDLTENTNEAITEQQVTYKGLVVNHQEETPIQTFDFSEKEYQNLFLKNLRNNGIPISDITELDQYISLEMVAKVAEAEQKNYPNVWDLDDQKVKTIQTNFPTLSNEELAQNLETIDDYYENNLRYHIMQILANSTKIGSSTTKSFYSNFSTCSAEIWFAIWHPSAAIDILNARNKALEYETQLYGGQSYGTKGDAFRHSIWSTLIAKYYAKRKKNINKGVNMSKKFTNLHEECNADEDVATYDIAMDKHNNKVGRDYFKQNASIKTSGWWIFKTKTLITLSDTEFKNRTKAKVDNAVKTAKNTTSINAVDINKLVYYK